MARLERVARGQFRSERRISCGRRPPNSLAARAEGAAKARRDAALADADARARREPGAERAHGRPLVRLVGVAFSEAVALLRLVRRQLEREGFGDGSARAERLEVRRERARQAEDVDHRTQVDVPGRRVLEE